MEEDTLDPSNFSNPSQIGEGSDSVIVLTIFEISKFSSSFKKLN